MKLFPIVTIITLNILLMTTVHAYNNTNVVSSFTIGDTGPGPVEITHKMINNIKKSAVNHAQELLHEPTDPIAGNPNGTTTLVQLVDFFCPTSERMDPDIQSLIKANPDLRVVYKPFPLRGPLSAYASRAALAAAKQGKYLALHMALMREHGNLTEEKILSIAQSVGLNVSQLKTDMQNQSYDQLIEASHALAKKIGVIGTPTFFFSKTDLHKSDGPDAIILLMGKFNRQDMQEAIDGTPP